MSSSSTAAAQADGPLALYALDQRPLEAAVENAVLLALKELSGDLPPADLAVLKELAKYRDVQVQGRLVLMLHGEAKQEIPVTAALVEWAHARPGRGITSLLGVLVNAALGLEGQDPIQRKRITALAPMIRSAMERPGAGLRGLLSGVHSVPELVRHIDDTIRAGSDFHKKFNDLWRVWLRDLIARWLMEAPGQLLQSFRPPPSLLVDLDAPQIPLWTDEGCEDDVLELEGTEISDAEFRGLGAVSTHALASAHLLLRKTGGSPLPFHPDQIVPVRLVQHLARHAISSGRTALDQSAAARAEPKLALALLIATGFREIDLQRIAWGLSNDEVDAAIAVDRPVISLRIRRPVNAVVPAEELRPWLEPVSERLELPLPASLHGALKELAGPGGSTTGRPVLPSIAQGAFLLRETVKELLPGAQFGAGRLRLVLAAALGERFGPEIAQLVLRDTLSTSTGPTYYGAIPEQQIATAVAELLERWFGENVPVPKARCGFLGSNLVLKAEIAREWPSRLRKATYAAARVKGGWRVRLTADRNLLACSLCAATGLRPGASIGSLMIDSVIPEYGLVVLEDKTTDLLRRTRVATTGWRWTAALRNYLDSLVGLLDDPDQAVAGWAKGVLTSEIPLFSLPASGGWQPFERKDLVETMPSVLKGVPNHYRHRLSQRLMEKGVDWELRHAQLGWVVTPTYALADTSPLSAKDLGSRLGPVIDELMLEDGWFTERQRLPNWSWHGVPVRPLKEWCVELERYKGEQAGYVRAVRERFFERQKELECQVVPRLAKAIAELLPALMLDQDARKLVPNFGVGRKGKVLLTMDHYMLLFEHVRRADDHPASAEEALAARNLIHRLVKKAIKEGVVTGPEPPRTHLGVTSGLSPFIPGLGLAVRHAEAVRKRLMELAAQIGLMTGHPSRN